MFCRSIGFSEQSEYSKLFVSDEEDNGLQERIIIITESTIYPDKQYLKSKIEEVMHCSSDNDLSLQLVSHDGKILTSEQLVEQYYCNPENYFDLRDDRSHVNTEPS